MRTPLVLPLLLPLLAAVAGLLLPRRRWVQRSVASLASAAHLVSSATILATVDRDGVQATQIGSWPAPFGITLVADLFSAMMLVVSGGMMLAVVVYSFAATDRERESRGYYPMLQILLMGVSGAFLAGDIFNMYVWYEVMLIASFVLLVLGGERPQLEGGVKYFALSLVASMLFLTGVGVLYGTLGTLNLAHLAARAGTVDEGLLTAVSILFMAAFGIKSALFPVFFWLPASYHTPPTAVSAIFAGLLTKVGVYSLIRVFTLVFVEDVGFTHQILLWASGLTMLTGVLGALSQNDVRRILSFHIISQIGYMVLGLALFSRKALAASIFYIVHHIVVKLNLFLVSGVMNRLGGSYDLARLGGLARRAPALAFLFLIPALSLAGVPPLSGFFAKLGLAVAGLELGAYLLVAVALFVGILTLLSMTKIWSEAFWKSAGPAPLPLGRVEGALLLLPIAALAMVTVFIGLGAGPVFAMAERAAAQLLDRQGYMTVVLGGSP